MTPTLLAALRTELGSVFSAERAERVRRLVLEDARDNVTDAMLKPVTINTGFPVADADQRAAAIRDWRAMIDALLTEG